MLVKLGSSSPKKRGENSKNIWVATTQLVLDFLRHIRKKRKSITIWIFIIHGQRIIQEGKISTRNGESFKDCSWTWWIKQECLEFGLWCWCQICAAAAGCCKPQESLGSHVQRTTSSTESKQQLNTTRKISIIQSFTPHNQIQHCQACYCQMCVTFRYVIAYFMTSQPTPGLTKALWMEIMEHIIAI